MQPNFPTGSSSSIPKSETHLNLAQLASNTNTHAGHNLAPSPLDHGGHRLPFAAYTEDYPMRRIKSASQLEASGDMMTQIFKQHECKISQLQRELMDLKQKVEFFEEDLGKTKWGVKYSRRITVLANLLLGFWVFFSRFMRRFQQRKAKLLQGMMVPGMRASDKTVNSFLYEAYVFSIAKSWVFFFATMLLASSQSWKRHCGLTISSVASLYYAYKSKLLPWTYYFNMFSNLLYLTAQWASSKPQFATKTIKDYIGPPLLDQQSAVWHSRSSGSSDDDDDEDAHPSGLPTAFFQHAQFNSVSWTPRRGLDLTSEGLPSPSTSHDFVYRSPTTSGSTIQESTSRFSSSSFGGS